ncbi:MAG: VOC family protein [Candidatus Roizmanbacteria bacterium]|nr:VOC family protein [Candidatus Roizmanbacteria bacterium]
MYKLTPHLWFDTHAKETTAFYVSLFPSSKIENITIVPDTPSGDCDFISFTLAGQSFMAISAGPYFKFNVGIQTK